MANLAIQGHLNRGNEVISYLEMLGGKNPYGCSGLGTLCAYHIINGNIQVVTITDVFKSNKYILYSLEGILAKFPYKVGDEVVYKQKPNQIFITEKACWNGSEIAYVIGNKNGVIIHAYADELQSCKEETMETITIDDFKANTKEWLIDKLHGMVISDAIKTISSIHDELYKLPKTYEECCSILCCRANDFFTDFSYNNCDVEISDYEDKIDDLLQNFRKLIYCRDAYWKIAGEQMGLGKPWEPNWKDDSDKYFICYLKDGLWMSNIRDCNRFLVFPTKEMRDVFYKNFKKLVETCKELL